MTIAITGAGGKLGRRVADLVLRSAPPSEVVLTTREPRLLDDLAARGVDVRRADFDQESTLRDAFRNIDRLLIVSTDADGVPGLRRAQHVRAVGAAAHAGVGHVTYTSVTRAEPGNPLSVAADHIATEEALRGSGLPWTSLRNNVYADGLMGLLGPALASGSYVVNSGAGAMANVVREDCARVAAAVLLADSPPAEPVLEVSGPEAVTAERLVQLVAEITGRVLQVVHVDDERYVAGLVASGLPQPVAESFASFGRATREGWLATVSDTVRSQTGRAPIPVRDVLMAGLRNSQLAGAKR